MNELMPFLLRFAELFRNIKHSSSTLSRKISSISTRRYELKDVLSMFINESICSVQNTISILRSLPHVSNA